MKKLYIALVLFVMCVSIGSCKKDPTARDTPKKYRLKSIKEDGGLVSEFEYDEKNRLVVMTHKGIRNLYTYDESDRLIENKIYVVNQNLLLTIETYLYEANKVELKVTDNLTKYIRLRTFELKDGKIVKEYGGANQNYWAYVYDSKDNLIKVLYKDATAAGFALESTYTYDDKKSPFSMMKGFNLHFYLSSVYPAYGLVNNIVEFQGNYKNVYQYNANGFPVSSTFTFGPYGYTKKIEFEYYIE